jgi:hypothetical protein
VLIYEQEAIFIMYRQRYRLLFVLLCTFLLCSSAHATILHISVRDRIDNTTIPYATVYLNGVDYAKTNTSGQVLITHPGLNDTLIRVSMTGYDDWENLVDKNETSILVNLSRKNLVLKVNLYNSDSLEPVAGARVNISARNLTQTNVTDASGSATFDVNAITMYSIDISAQDYEYRTGRIDIGNDDKNAQYWLLYSNRFSFVIKDRNSRAAVPDAEVRLDSVLAGKTDTRGILTIPVSRGKAYAIEIKKSGYLTISESRIINETDALYSVALTKAPLGAFFSVFDEDRVPINGTDIYINGTLSGTTNQSGRSVFPDLVTGSYIVEVRKTGYLPVNRTILLNRSGQDYSFVLPFERADLTIFVMEKDQKIVPNATIMINGVAAGATDDHGQYMTRVKFNTLYNITAEKDTYQPSFVQKQVIRGNATGSVTIVMEKSPDWSIIILIVVGALGILVLFWATRMRGGKKRRHVVRKNEI